MRVRLIFVPPGGGEADYSLDFELPSVPQPGDYISIKREDSSGTEDFGTEDFIVRRTLWELEYPEVPAETEADKRPHGSVKRLWVECEFAIGPWSTESHRRTAERLGAEEFEATAY